MSQDKTTSSTTNVIKAKKAGALGKGYEALLGLSGDEYQKTDPSRAPVQTEDQSFQSSDAVHMVEIQKIEPNPHQPRKIFDREALQSLSESIKHDGVIQPIIVTTTGAPKGKYTLIAGERRWRASQLAGLDKIPVIIKETTPNSMLRIALIENIQRAELSIIEEAEAYQSLISDFGLTQEQCAKQVGKDRTTVTNALRLLALPKEIQEDLMSSRLTMGHGRALTGIEEKRNILRARDIVIKKGLSVRQTEQLCRRFKNKADDKVVQAADGSASIDMADLEYLVDAIRTHLRTKVSISGTASKGKIEVSYFTNAELERIIGLLGVTL